jgi:hypothetical protein
MPLRTLTLEAKTTDGTFEISELSLMALLAEYVDPN